VGTDADVVVVEVDVGVVVVEVRRPPCPAVGGETKNHDDVKPGEDDPVVVDWDFVRAAAADDDADGRSRTIAFCGSRCALNSGRKRFGPALEVHQRLALVTKHGRGFETSSFSESSGPDKPTP